MSSNGAQPPTSQRKNHGRGHSYWIDGVKVPGVTSGVLGKGFPKQALINWAAETTAGYAVDHWDDLAELTPSKRLKQLMRARFDVVDEARVRGVKLHDLARRHMSGEEVEVPEALEPLFEQYEAFLAEWVVRDLVVEQPLFSRRYRYGGTPDLIAELVDGRVWLLDYKSTAKGIFLEHVLQLAALRHADYMLDPDGREIPLPQIDAVGAVWLRADGYELYPVEADARAFAIFRAVKLVAGFVESERDDWIGDALDAEVRVA